MHVTSVEPLSVVVVTRGDVPQAPFMKPILDAYESDQSNTYATDWNVIFIGPRKGKPNGIGGWNTLPKGPNSKIPWDIFIMFRPTEASDWKQLGKNLANKLTTFSDLSDEYHTKVPFLFRRVVTGSSQPLNKYLLDRDVMRLVKRSYSDSSIKDVVEDSNILERFFGSAKAGKQALKDVTEDEWKEM